MGRQRRTAWHANVTPLSRSPRRLRQLESGIPAVELCRRLGVHGNTLSAWKKKSTPGGDGHDAGAVYYLQAAGDGSPAIKNQLQLAAAFSWYRECAAFCGDTDGLDSWRHVFDSNRHQSRRRPRRNHIRRSLPTLSDDHRYSTKGCGDTRCGGNDVNATRRGAKRSTNTCSVR